MAGALGRLAAVTGQPAETIALPSPVKPVDGPDGPALLDAAIGEHRSNTDVHALMSRVLFRDDRVAGLDWEATAPAASWPTIASPGVPMLVRAGWLDGAFAAGALARFVTRLRFLHRRTTGPAEPARLGVPRTFARSDALRVVPGNPMNLIVQLLPVSAIVPADHRVRVAIAGHGASCFTRYGPAQETFTLRFGSDSHLDLPVRYG